MSSSVIKPLTFGCDPEFGLFDKKTNRLVSAYGLIPGTKAAPHKVTGGAIQVDGMMVEFNIDPAKDGKQFTDNINSVMTELRKFLPQDRYDFIFNPSIFFDPGYMKELPKEATELGCSPDYNAWAEGGVNPRPSPPASVPGMRSCGGHIHIGWTENADITDLSHRWDCCAVVRVLDTYVLPLLEMIEPDKFRQELYGKPGAFRPKPYGVEWRTPSNVWLRDKGLYHYMINYIHHLVKALFSDQGKLLIANKLKSPWSFPHLSSPHPYGDALNIASVQFARYIMGLVKYDDTSIVQGVRVAATSGKVNFDLNLDIAPVGTKRNYTYAFYLDKKDLNPIIT